RTIPITETLNAALLHDELAALGATAIVEAIAALKRGTLTAQPQPDDGVTYAAKLDKSESALDFNQPAVALARRIRAFNPVPGSTVALPGLKDAVKVWNAVAMPEATASADSVQPGQVLQAGPHGIDIATASGVLRLLELQKAGGKRQPVAAFVQGWQER